MQFSISSAALVLAAFAAPSLVSACCDHGCYSVKGEGFTDNQCDGTLSGASIANFGAQGSCVDISADQSLRAHNDGCGSSHPLFQFFSDTECVDKMQSVQKQGGGECFPKPSGAKSMIVISH